jgi:ribosomal-protein-alanine N-acetyltransferase
MEICIRPENAASRRVVEKLGFRYEGFRERYIHINGAWRDHVCFAVTAEEVPHGVLARWRAGAVPAGLPTAPPFAGFPVTTRTSAAGGSDTP